MTTIIKAKKKLPRWAGLIIASTIVAIIITCVDVGTMSLDANSLYPSPIRMNLMFPLVIILLALGIWSFVYMFYRWRVYRFAALLPFLAYILVVVAANLVANVRADQVFRDTPSRPETFFNSIRQSSFQAVAENLLNRGLKRIFIQSERVHGELDRRLGGYTHIETESDRRGIDIETESDYGRMTGSGLGKVEPEIWTFFKANAIRSVEIDDDQRTVSFGYCIHRKWHTYIYSQRDLKSPYTMNISKHWYYKYN